MLQYRTIMSDYREVNGFLDIWAEAPASVYLFSGPRYVGKRRLGERFVRQLGSVEKGRTLETHPDIHLLQPEEGTEAVKIEQVRHLRAQLYNRPQHAKRRVAYLPYLNKLNEAGFNALLKVMEEPPAGAVFVCIAERLSDIPATILSRAVCISIKPMAYADTAEVLRAEGDLNAMEKARMFRGRVEAARSEEDPWEPYREAANKFVDGPEIGNRIAAAQELTRLCGDAESWRDALEVCGDAVRNVMREYGGRALVLGQGVADAERCIGTAVSPAVMLEAAAVRCANRSMMMPSIYPNYLPLSVCLS